MSLFEGMAPGDLEVTQSGTVNGMVSRDLIVAPGCQVDVKGMVGRNVIVRPGADVNVFGMVGGKIIREAENAAG